MLKLLVKIVKAQNFIETLQEKKEEAFLVYVVIVRVLVIPPRYSSFLSIVR